MYKLEDNFFLEIKKDIKTWFYFIFINQLSRIYFIFCLKKYIGYFDNIDLINILIAGLKYDIVFSSLVCLPLTLFFSLPKLFKYNYENSNIIRFIITFCFTALISILNVLQIEFFKEFKDIFNEIIFEFYFDDTKAIFSTIFKDYTIIMHFIFNVSILFLSLIIIYLINYKTYIKNNSILNFMKKYIIVIIPIIIIFYFIGIRGSIGNIPIQLKNISISKNHLLNKSVLGCLPSAKNAIKIHLQLNKLEIKRSYYKKINFKKIFTIFFNRLLIVKNYYYSFDSLKLKKIIPNIKKQPKHIFFIVGESLDIWPLLKKYEEIRLYKEINKLIKTGLFFPSFLPMSDSTIFALNAFTTGLPDFKIHLNYKIESYKTFITSINPQIKNLGYKSQFFFGGNLSWQRIGDFVKKQGFNKIYGAENIFNLNNKNEWGVDDEILFNFIIKKIKKNKKTFNLIMTTSNHPPYTIELKKLKFNINNKIKSILIKYKNKNMDLEKIGHHWYNDKCLGKFIKIVEYKYKNILFIITGDHFSKRHIKNDPSLYEKNSVPLIIYSKNVLNNFNIPKYVSGNHLDISLTLIALIANKDIGFYGIGKNLLQNNKLKIAIGNKFIISSNYIIDIRKDFLHEMINNKELNYFIDIQNLRRYYKYYYFMCYRETLFSKIGKMGPLGFEPRTKGL